MGGRGSVAPPVSSCAICGPTGPVRPFLRLGDLPPGNAFVRRESLGEERSFPLDVGWCERCALVQIVDPVPPATLEKVYRNYSYVPTGSTLGDHYRALAEDIVSVVRPRADALFTDIGSNDGLLLRSVLAVAPAAHVAGVEPSPRISEIARGHGVPTLTRFFDAAAADELLERFGRADVVSATQVLQHVRDPVGFLREVGRLLREDGVVVLEGRAYFPAVVEKVSFDTFYHELLFCFTLRSLEALLERAGLSVFHAARTEAYGGSLRVFAQAHGSGHRPVRPSVEELRAFERAAGVSEWATYERFGARAQEVAGTVGAMVRRLRSEGRRIVGYGAPSTGTTLLGYCGLNDATLDYVVDDNPLKQGLIVPGAHVPIAGSSALAERPPEYVLLIAWRLKDEILPKLAASVGDRLRGAIVPLPRPEIVPAPGAPGPR